MFTGDGGIGVKQFLRRLDLWFVGAGDEFNRETLKSKKRRVAQIHLTFPVNSIAERFISKVDETILWDEELLRKALVDRFYDGAREDQADKDVLTTMSKVGQGKQDVFKYSRRVIKLLQRMPSDLKRYDDIVIGYYLDGLTSQRLHDLAVSNFRKRDSCETPLQVVQNVIHLAIQMKMKGYRNQINELSEDEEDDDDDDEDDDEDDEDDDDNDNNNATYAAGIDFGSDDEGDSRGRGRYKRKVGKTASVKIGSCYGSLYLCRATGNDTNSSN